MYLQYHSTRHMVDTQGMYVQRMKFIKGNHSSESNLLKPSPILKNPNRLYSQATFSACEARDFET